MYDLLVTQASDFGHVKLLPCVILHAAEADQGNCIPLFFNRFHDVFMS